MDKSLFEQVLESKKDYEVGQVIFYNNGKVDTETNSYVNRKMKYRYDKYEIEEIVKDLCGATGVYSRSYDFDKIEMTLNIGLLYKPEDIDKNKKPKENAEPTDDLVRFYEDKFNCYRDGKKLNDRDFGENNTTTQGYVSYDKLVKAFDNSGLDFNGPRTFDELKTRITNGENFPISVTANFEVKEKEEEEKSFVKRLFRK